MKSSGTPLLVVKSFGSFSVTRGGTLLSGESKRSQKIWLLFKYLITNMTRRIPAEELIDILWSEEECVNPQKALQNLVYRLRNMLSADKGSSIETYIQFSQGCYFWNSAAVIEFDAKEFEKLNAQGQFLESSEQLQKAVEMYQQAIAMYRGNYMSEIAYLDWVVPVSNYYNRMYLTACLHLSRMLRKLDRPNDVLTVCEEAFRIEPYDEALHICFIEALLDLGKTKQARQHYEYITDAFAREFGVKPSDEMRALYSRIHKGADNIQLDLDIFQELLSEKGNIQGALFCDSDTFRSIYQLEMRRSERLENVAYLMVITLMTNDYTRPNGRELKEAMESMSELLVNLLRQGDVVSCWNDSQYVLLSPTPTFENGELVLHRIVKKFNDLNKNKNLIIKHKLQPVKLTHS